MAIAIEEDGLEVSMEEAVPVRFRGHSVGVFRADPVIERRIILELKLSDQISKAHEAQLLHYLRASSMEVGLILCFGETPEIRRVEFKNERKHPVVRCP